MRHRWLPLVLLGTGLLQFFSALTANAADMPTRLVIEPRNAVLASGEQYPYEAWGVYADGHREDLSARVDWSSTAASTARVDNAAGAQHGTVTAGQLPGTVSIRAALGSLSAETPLTVTLVNRVPTPQRRLDVPTKELDLVGVESLIYPGIEYRRAASQMFRAVLGPYNLAVSDAERAQALKRVKFSCHEDREDPTTPGHLLAFPFDLDGGHQKALLWHRYQCTFTLDYDDALGAHQHYTSPVYRINQLDIDYGRYPLEAATAFQNYDLGTGDRHDYAFLGRYVQPLDKMLRRRDNTVPTEFLAGVNGGYDYRVDAWSSSTSDNICPPRTSPVDRNHFYTHPAPAQCPMDANALPSCANGSTLPYGDDLGDSLVLLPRAERDKSWRDGPFQSFNCGGLGEVFDRGVVAFYADDVATFRTSANRGDVAELLHAGKKPLSALGCGPLLIRDRQFVYHEGNAEEGMPIDNYEISGTAGIGYEHLPDGRLRVHLAVIDGNGNTEGFHNWMLGPYFLSPYAHSDGANTLGNGGDATFWIHPQGRRVQSVLRNAQHANHAFFKAIFADNGNPGVASNCDFGPRPISCRARPVHDGVFVRLPRSDTP